LGSFAIHGPNGLKTIVAQVNSDQFGNGGLILDDENAR
jgi:hypothetical protein